jgi:hypothetical protein
MGLRDKLLRKKEKGPTLEEVENLCRKYLSEKDLKGYGDEGISPEEIFKDTVEYFRSLLGSEHLYNTLIQRYGFREEKAVDFAEELYGKDDPFIQKKRKDMKKRT